MFIRRNVKIRFFAGGLYDASCVVKEFIETAICTTVDENVIFAVFLTFY
jgi:hypothetical protein